MELDATLTGRTARRSETKNLANQPDDCAA